MCDLIRWKNYTNRILKQNFIHYNIQNNVAT